MVGRRLPDGFEPTSDWYGRLGVTKLDEVAGGYGKDSSGAWCVITPNGRYGSIAKHTVVEHEDQTITVTPSILVYAVEGRQIEPDIREQLRESGYEIDANGYWPGRPEWHGYLERGIWREC